MSCNCHGKSSAAVTRTSPFDQCSTCAKKHVVKAWSLFNEFLYRVSYDPFQPNRLLISGQFPGGEIFSWAYQPGMKKLYEVAADGVPAYKCAFYEGDCYYAKREAKFEERHIFQAESLELNELPAEEHIVETEEFTYARPENQEFE